MAARENQGYLIAVIVLVLLSLLLALAAFLGMSKASEYADGRDAADKKFNAEKKLSDALRIESEILKAYIGDLGPTVALVPTQIDQLKRLTGDSTLDANQKTQIQTVVENVDAIQAIYTKDMLGNIATGEEGQAEEFTWRSLNKNLSTALVSKRNEFQTEFERARVAELEAETKIEEKDKQVQQMASQVETLKKDLTDEKSNSAAKQLELTKSLQAGETQLLAANDKYDAYVQTIDEQISGEEGYLEQIATVSKENTSLKGKINTYEREVFDLPDGHIVKVASGLDMVFIDLGRIDGLTENRTFAVYSQKVTNFEKGQHKAMIEVTRVGETQSEARVTMEENTNPILGGDYVLTATWDPGHAVPMALAGYFDLDHDKASDLDKLIQLIKRNGGEVVAYHDEQGKIIGKIDSSVRYLVLGEAQTIGPDANPAVNKAMSDLEKQADANTIQKISLQKLLNKMGMHAQSKVERLDRRVGGFEKRSPPSSSLKSEDQ